MQKTAADVPPLVALERVGKVFHGGTTALLDISLNIIDGSFVSLLGPSGCGKSTLLRIVAGLTSPTTGRVALADDDLAGKIGFVFQEPTLMPWATVWENVYLPLRVAGKRRNAVADRIVETLAAVGLGGFEGSYPRQLSGGMRMRVSIARALVTEPRLLLLDEPFAALDEITRFKLNEDLLTLWQRHHWTVIFVTHSVFESVFLSDRIVMLAPRPGRVVDDIAIDLPYPRDAGLRTSLAYAEACHAVSYRLAETAR